MLNSLALIFLLALTLGYLCKLIKLPALLGMLLSGIILGPYALDLIDGSILDISIELRKIALVIILLRAGLSLNIGELRVVGRPAMLMCFVPAAFEIVGVMIIAPLLFDISLLEAALMGSVLAAISPAVVVPKMIDLMERGVGVRKGIPQMIMAGGSVDDVFVIVIFTSLMTLFGGGEISATNFTQIPLSIVFGLLLGMLSGVILNLFFRRFHMRDSVKMLIMLSISFLFLGAEELLSGTIPVSGLLAVMAMGAMINLKYDLLAKRISPKFNKLWIAAEIILFVLVGATVDLAYATSAGFVALGVIVGALLFRMVGVYLSMLRSPLNFKERLFCMIAYTPKATVQAAIGSIPLAAGLSCGSLVLTVAVLAIIITAPLGAFGIDVSHKRLLQG